MERNDHARSGVSRRGAVSLLAGAAALPSLAAAEGDGPKTVLYVSVGSDLVAYGVDANALTLARGETTRLPAAIQYAWLHPRLPILYVCYSNRFTSKTNDIHGVAAFGVERGTGRLTPSGAPVPYDNRPINLTVDPAGRHLLVAFNAPSELVVHPLGSDGAIGPAIQQGMRQIDFGIYAHQVRVAPSGDLVVMSTRGNDPTDKAKEDPGAFKIFRFRDGQLSDETSVAENNGIGFGPRHVDFHPTKPWMFASMERNNQLLAYRVEAGGIGAHPAFIKATVEKPELRLPTQYAGPIHVHPNGRTVYLANRSDATVEYQGRKVHAGGENTVAVFALDEASGAPTLVQSIPTRTFHVRTFTIHPAGRMLVTASVAPLAVREGDEVRTVPAGLTVFSVAHDGRLAFARTYDVEVGSELMFWSGMVTV